MQIRSVYDIEYGGTGTGFPANQTKVHGTNIYLSSTTPTRSATTATYTVSFNTDGASTDTPSSQTATKTTSYTFDEWSGSDGNSYDAGKLYSTNADLTLTAKWTSSSTTTSITLPSTPTKKGKTFLGWYTSSGTRAGYPGATYTPSGSITLTAKWGDPIVIGTGD
jgi:uncharacterized repeat protein (TIGR02543 family)